MSPVVRAKDTIDPISILLACINQAKFSSPALGEKVRELGDAIGKDLEVVKYEPHDNLIEPAKEVAAILLSSITGADRLSLVPINNDEEEDEEDNTGSRISSRRGDDDEEED